MPMFIDQSIESFENWRDLQHNRPEPDSEAPDEHIKRSFTHDHPDDTTLTYTRTEAERDLNQQVVWKPIETEKQDWLYSAQRETDAERGCIGHLRGDFGRGGNEFWTSWFDHTPRLKSAAFREELQSVVNHLREEGGLLSGFAAMRRQCRSGLACDDSYGFRAETAHYEYCLRCIPRRDDYHFYLYFYDKDTQREHAREKAAPVRDRKTKPKRNHEMER